MLVEHVRFLAQKSPDAAQRLTTDIVAATKSLERFPERDPWFDAPSLPPNKYRKMVVSGRYLVIYQIRSATVFVELVLDCRSDYAWLLP